MDTRAPAKKRSKEWEQRDLVWKCGLEKREKMVLLAFLDFDRSANGVDLYPSLIRIADGTGYSYRSVQMATDKLEIMGALKVVGRVSSRYELRGRVSKYRFHPDRLPPGPRPRQPRRATRGVSRDNQQPLPPVNLRQPAIPVATPGNSEVDNRQFQWRHPAAIADDRLDRLDRLDRSPRASHAAPPLEENKNDDDREARMNALAKARAAVFGPQR